MEVSVISTETIKPWSSSSSSAAGRGRTTSNHEFNPPLNLCLLDQLMCPIYSPLILFYPATADEKPVGRRLKSSLSKTLDTFYPVSGRVKDNLIIHDFQQGVPFTEARATGNHRHLSDLLADGGPKLELLNNLLPFEPLCYYDENDVVSTPPPLLAVQLTTFDCGGVAVGLSMFHKLMDGVTGSSFFQTWAANCTGGTKTTSPPEFFKASSVFQPRTSIPPEYHVYLKELYFQGGRGRRQKGSARRFVFDSAAIAALRTKARSSGVTNPTRIEALSAFIWASAMRAAKAADATNERLQYFSQAVNLRPLMSPRLSNHSAGNLFTTAMASGKDIDIISDDSNPMNELVGRMREGMARVRESYSGAVFESSEEWFMAKLEGLKVMREVAGGESGGRILSCSSWIGFGSSFDFGCGKPVWSGLSGNPSGERAYLNDVVVFKELAPRGREGSSDIEAWVRLDEDVMAVLERDPHFLQYASPNPSIIMN